MTGLQVVFQSSSFDLSFPDDPDVDPNDPPVGKDLAEYLRKEFINVKAKVSEPYEISDGWIISVEFSTSKVNIDIFWAPLGKPSEAECLFRFFSETVWTSC